MVDVVEQVVLRTPADVLAQLPSLPTDPFTTRELAAVSGCRILLAQRAMYCLRALGLVEPAGRRGRAPLYALAVKPSAARL